MARVNPRRDAQDGIADAIEIKDCLATFWTDLASTCDGSTKLARMSTGFISVDRAFGDLRRGDFIVVASRPSMGRTEFVTSLAVNVALQSRCLPAGTDETRLRVLVFSLELKREALIQRVLAARSGVRLGKILRADISEEDEQRLRAASDELSRTDLAIDDTPGLSIAELETRARLAAMSAPLDLVVVDGMTQVRGRRAAAQDRSGLACRLKELGQELSCAVIATANLNRNVESQVDKRPLMDDLTSQNGPIDRHADIVATLYREVVYDKDASPTDVELNIMRGRDGTGDETALLRFDVNSMAFSERFH